MLFLSEARPEDCDALGAVKKLPASHKAPMMDQEIAMTIQPSVDGWNQPTSKASDIRFKANIVLTEFCKAHSANLNFVICATWLKFTEFGPHFLADRITRDLDRAMCFRN